LNEVLVPYRKDIVDLEGKSLSDPYLPLLTVLSKLEEYSKLFEILNYMIKQVSQFCIMSVGFELLTVVVMNVAIFWNVALCRPYVNQRFFTHKIAPCLFVLAGCFTVVRLLSHHNMQFGTYSLPILQCVVLRLRNFRNRVFFLVPKIFLPFA
jgi:hypothetical protein